MEAIESRTTGVIGMLRSIQKAIAFLLPFGTLGLIFMGSLVTSHYAGLSVPDWPTSFGENMFLFPPSKWQGGIFYEHVHRLIASGIGMATLALSVLTLYFDDRAWLKVTTLCALLLVIFQGVLGGLTVLYQLPTPISTLHAVLAQTFLLVSTVICFSHTSFAKNANFSISRIVVNKSHYVLLALIMGIYLQLIFGAAMRHSHAGLAVLEFPWVSGNIVPSLSSQTLGQINEARDFFALGHVTKGQVIIHLLHRYWAYALTIFMLIVSFVLLKEKPWGQNSRLYVLAIDSIFACQFVLGAATLLSLRTPIIASLHVLIGATFLVFLFSCLLISLYKAQKK